MGIEYRLQFTAPDAATVVSVLQRLPMVQKVAGDEPMFELRTEQTTDTMPDAVVSLQPDGIYFCDNRGSGKQLLGVLIARLVSEFGPVTVAEWE